MLLLAGDPFSMESWLLAAVRAAGGNRVESQVGEEPGRVVAPGKGVSLPDEQAGDWAGRGSQ